MISKKAAQKRMIDYNASAVMLNLKHLSSVIDLNASLGYGNVELFVAKKISNKAHALLEKKGFYVTVKKPKVLKQSDLFYIDWSML